MGTYRKKIKSNRILAAVLMLALLAGGVGLGIHLLHRDALAQNTVFRVDIVWLEHDDNDVDFVAILTWDEFDELVDAELADNVDEGVWKVAFVPGTTSVTWEAFIAAPGIEFEEGNSQLMGEFDWGESNQCTFHEE